MTGVVVIEFLTAVLVLLGSGFALVGSIGLARLPDIFTRLHGPTKATTLGVGAVVIASLLHFNAVQDTLSLREFAIPLFLFITAPVSAHLIAKVARKAQTDAARDAGSSP